MKQIFALVAIFSIVLSVIPLPAQGIVLVPCGRTVYEDGSNSGDPSTAPCTLDHLIILIVRMINYLTSIAALVAMYFILLAGFTLITALGNPEKIEHGKESLSHAVIGFVIVVLAFVFINLAVNGLFATQAGRSDPSKQKKWWSLGCIYDITEANCAVGSSSN